MTDAHSPSRSHRGWLPGWPAVSRREAVACLGAAVLAVCGVRLATTGSTDGATAVGALAERRELPPPGGALQGEAARRFCQLLLADGVRRLDGVRDARAVFHKRERVEGELQDLNVMDLKVRRTPLSVYMRWREPDAGREVIWQENAHDGLILVQPGGWRRKVLPLIKVDPLGERAMEYSRRPIMSIGLWNFAARMAALVDDELAGPELAATMTQDTLLAGRPAYCFRFEHARPREAAFSRVLIFVDQELGLPTACEVYGPAVGGEPPLEESYAFNDVLLDPGLTDLDFDMRNPAYDYLPKD